MLIVVCRGLISSLWPKQLLRLFASYSLPLYVDLV